MPTDIYAMFILLEPACLSKKKEERRLVFLNVPVKVDDAALETGIHVTIEQTRAIVHSGRMRKLVHEEASAASTTDSIGSEWWH
jgi:hypothetical protein